MQNAEIEDARVVAQLKRIEEVEDFELVISSRVLKALEHINPPGPGRKQLLRGLNSGSPSFALLGAGGA